MPFAQQYIEPQLKNSLQHLFQQNNIPIDLENNTGLEMFLAADQEGKWSSLFDPRKLKTYNSSNPYNEAEWNERFAMLKNGLDTGSIMLQLPGEDSPRSLRIRENNIPELSQPANQIKEPSRPGFFKRLLHGLNKNLFQEDFEKYGRDKQEYDRIQTQARSYADSEAIQERESILNEARHTRQQTRMNTGLEQIRAVEKEQIRAGEKAVSTVDALLDEIFAKAEQNSNMDVNRTNMVAIDGRPISAILKEQMENNAPESLASERDEADNLWADRGVEYIRTHNGDAGKLVASALLEGRNVQVFPVQSGGRITGGMRMLKADSVLKGLSDEERQLAVKQIGGLIPGKKLSGNDAHVRMDEAAKIILTNNFFTEKTTNHLSDTDKFLPFAEKWAKANPDKVLAMKPGDELLYKINNPRGFSLTRTVLQSTMLGNMLHRGYPIKEILDPSKLLEEKQNMVNEILDCFSSPKEDESAGRKVGELNVNGRFGCIDYIQKVLSDFDVSNPEQIFSPKGRELFECTFALFDLGQERAHCYKETKDYMLKLCDNDAKKADEMFESLETAASGFAADYVQAVMAQKKLVDAALGYKSKGEQFVDSVGSFGMLESLHQIKKDNPGKDPLQLISWMENFMLNESRSIVVNGESSTMQKNEYAVGAVNVEELGRSCFCGKIRKDLNFTYKGGHLYMNLKSEQRAAEKTQPQAQTSRSLVK